MATNRLELKHVPTGECFRIAKFYHGTGWYVNVETDDQKIAFVDKMNDWFEVHRATSDDMFNLGANYILEYEDGDPINAERPEAD